MRIVCISDTHNNHHKVTVPEGDVLIHAGDLTLQGELGVLKRFNEWIGDLPHKAKFVIAGNHDFGLTAEKANEIIPNVTFLEDSGARYDGLYFYGSPFTPLFGEWAFMLPRGTPMMEKWLKIPHYTDVLITHGPPRGILDSPNPKWTRYHTGCDDLATVVLAQKPKLHVFGHIHGGHGYKSFNDTIYVNAAVSDEAYHPVNPAIVVDL